MHRNLILILSEHMRTIFITSLTLLTFSICWSQPRTNPKSVRAKGTYEHVRTSTQFPEVLDVFERQSVYSFDRQNTNIGVTYERPNSETTFSIYVYPAGAGTEDRFRTEYLNSMQSVANVNDGIGATQYPIRFEQGDFKINGFAAELKKSDELSRLLLYECGSWFLKYRVTSIELDSLGMNDLVASIEEWFSPSLVASRGLLNPKADISFAQAAFADSTMLYTTMGEAFKKMEWVMENVDSVERRTGFPGLYLELYTNAIQERVELWKKSNTTSSPKTDELLSQYESIVNSGFLKEFIMDQFMMVMITPDSLTLDMDGYSTWIQENPLDINLNQFYYVISFSE